MCESCLKAEAEWTVEFRATGTIGALTIDVCTDCLPIPDEGDDVNVLPIGEVVLS